MPIIVNVDVMLARRKMQSKELAEKLGSFAGQLTETGISKVTITYEGHVAEMKIKALTSAALSGLLRPMLGDINVVSAPVVAKEPLLRKRKHLST